MKKTFYVFVDETEEQYQKAFSSFMSGVPQVQRFFDDDKTTCANSNFLQLNLQNWYKVKAVSSPL